jgi:[acyl-carrier-protein] S-malonyltransferase
MDVVVLFPGQGSQKPGMAKDLVDAFPAARDVFARGDAALGTSLSQLCFQGPADVLTLTQNAQPALLAHGAAVWAVARAAVAPRVRAVAGHSLGEFTAYHAAGALSLEDAIRVVRRRGALMFESGTARPGAMAAVLGDASVPIEEICRRASEAADGGVVVAANYNAPGQVVISGEVAGVERAIDLLKDAGVKRAIRLSVSGAFHSPLMATARDGLRETLREVPMQPPEVPVYANVTAQPVRDVSAARQLLVEQLTAPVRWTDLVQRLVADFPDALFVEMGPGSVLTGLLRKIAPAAQGMACGTAGEVDQLLTRLAA